MQDLSLDYIIDKCRKGNRQAQAELYRRYYKAMYNVSLRILNHSAEAEDVMQEAFISAFKQLSKFRGEVSFGVWLKRIVINKSIDHTRKRKELLKEEVHLLEETDEIVEVNYSEIRAEEIRKCIGRLPDNYRIVLTLFLMEGYDHDEIAEILNISNGSSRTIYHRAKTKLKSIIVESGVEYSNYG